MLRAFVLSVSIALSAGVFGGCNGASCEPYAGNPGACNNFVGYTWNGTACVAQAGCLCEGDGCPGVYADLSTCQSAHTLCGVDGASDVVSGP
jgi:hypothetical protein